MAEEASINFYRIARCGYYRHGRTVPEFCLLADALHELVTWVKDGEKTLGETCTYKIDDGEAGLPVIVKILVVFSMLRFLQVPCL
jgi:hypothetical protein